MSRNIMTVGVLTISDSRKKENDESGKNIIGILQENNYEIAFYKVITDDKDQIQKELLFGIKEYCPDMILTVGGTGLGPRDNTPEATALVVDRIVPGVPELIRLEGCKKTQNACLSRGIAGIKENTLIVNLPGSPKGSRESLEAIISIVPHAISMIKGEGH